MNLSGIIQNTASRFFQALLIGLLTLYRYLVSPILHMLAPGSGCRFEPTCSAYALESVRKHGPLAGSWMAIKRLARCHPWGGHGYDPVPHSCSCTGQPDLHHPSTLGPSIKESQQTIHQSQNFHG